MKTKTFYQQGISLLEVLLSLSIIAIILVMATQYFFVASNNDHINVLREELGSVVAAVHSWKGQNPEYTADLNYQRLSDAGFLPNSRFLSAGGSQPGLQLYDPWGQPVNMQASNSGVTLSVNLPKMSDCISLQNSYPQASCQASGRAGSLFTLQIS